MQLPRLASFLDAFVKDDENNKITPVCLSVQKGVVGDVIENFKMFGSG